MCCASGNKLPPQTVPIFCRVKVGFTVGNLLRKSPSQLLWMRGERIHEVKGICLSIQDSGPIIVFGALDFELKRMVFQLQSLHNKGLIAQRVQLKRSERLYMLPLVV